MQEFYRYKYYLNASHSFDGNEEHSHSHTFVITLCIQVENEFVSFVSVDQKLEEYFEHFSGQYLNENERFAGVSPTIENMGDIFYEELKERLLKRKMNLLQLEIMETPVRSYMISDCLLLPSDNASDNMKRWEAILEKKRYLYILQKRTKGES